MYTNYLRTVSQIDGVQLSRTLRVRTLRVRTLFKIDRMFSCHLGAISFEITEYVFMLSIVVSVAKITFTIP